MKEKISKEDAINALNCAVNVLEGTAGGFQKREKDAAKETLRKMLSNIAGGKDWDGGDKPIPHPPGS